MLSITVILAVPSASAQGQSQPWRVAGNGYGAMATVGNDYSNGTPYANAASGDQMVWNGPGSNWCIGDCSSVYLQGSTLGWQRAPHHLENTYAGGSFEAAPVLNLDAAGQVVAINRLHLWAVLDNNTSNFAQHPVANLRAVTEFDSGGQGKVPLHWRVDWSFSVSPGFSAEAPPYWGAGLRVPGDGSWGSEGEFFAVTANSSGSISGVLGDLSYPWDDVTQYAGFVGSLGLREFIDWHGHGRADLFATLSFSRAPITSAVPEPGTIGLWLLGLTSLALLRRRTRR
jgi:hypothetical protein